MKFFKVILTSLLLLNTFNHVPIFAEDTIEEEIIIEANENIQEDVFDAVYVTEDNEEITLDEETSQESTDIIEEETRREESEIEDTVTVSETENPNEIEETVEDEPIIEEIQNSKEDVVNSDEQTYTLTLDANGGTFADGSTTKQLSASANRLLEKTDMPKRDYFVLDGWYYDKECTQLFNKSISDFIDWENQLDRSTTIYAKWEKANRVYFDPNGGRLYNLLSKKYLDSYYFQGKSNCSNSITFMIIAVHPNDEPFLGWYYDKEFTQPLEHGFIYVGNEDSTVYARFGVLAQSAQIIGPDTVKVRDSIQLSYELEPEGSVRDGLRWNSANPEIATIDENGLLTAIAPGTVKITLVADSGFYEEKTIQVTRATEYTVDITDDSIQLVEGDKKQLTTITIPEGNDVTVVWTSDNPDIVNVDNNGLLVANEVGEATITASIEDKELAEAIENAKQEYNDVLTNIENDSKYISLKKDVEDRSKALTASKDTRDNALATVNEAKANYESAKAVQDEKKATLEDKKTAKAKAEKLLAEAESELVVAYDDLDKKISDADQLRLDITDGEVALATAQSNYENAVKELETIKSEVIDGEAELATYKKALDDAEKAVTDAQAKIALGSYGFFEEYATEESHALKILDMVVEYQSSEQWLTDTAQLTSEEREQARTIIGDERDATSLENMKRAIAFIREGNELRTTDNNFPGLNELLVTDAMMASAQVNANASYDVEPHWRWLRNNSIYSTGENTARGWEDAYDGWYDIEKQVYDYLAVHPELSIGKNAQEIADALDIWVGYVQTGHYDNIVWKRYKTTGFAIDSKDNYSGDVQTQEFSIVSIANEDDSEKYTVDEYEARFMEYYNKVNNALTEAQAQRDKAKADLEQAQSNIDKAKAEHERKVAEAEDKVDIAEMAVYDAQYNLKEAKAALIQQEAAVATQETVVTEKETAVENAKTEVVNAQKQIEIAEAELAEATTVVAETETEVSNAEAVLATKEQDVAEKQNNLDAANTALNEYIEELKRAKKEKLDNLLSELSIISDTCKVTVIARGPDSISLNKESLQLVVGSSEALKATLEPSSVTDTAITWTSSNTSIASVDQQGVITAHKAGTATITVETSNGKKATCKVTVKNPITNVTSVKVSSTNATLTVGKTTTLKATVSPSNATNKKVTWTSSDTNVAKVDAYGKVTAVNGGTATITVTTQDGKKTAKATVTVNMPKVQAVAIYNSAHGADIRWKPINGVRYYGIWRKRTNPVTKVLEEEIVQLIDTNTYKTKDGGNYKWIDPYLKDKYTDKGKEWEGGWVYYVTARSTSDLSKQYHNGEDLRIDGPISNKLNLYRLRNPELKTVTANGSGKVTVTWSNVPTAHGYEVQYSADNGKTWTKVPEVVAAYWEKNGKEVKVPGYKPQVTISNLPKGKQLAFRIRCRKTNTSLGVTWSEYSPWKKVTVK